MGVMMDAWWCLPTKQKVRARALRDGMGEKQALEVMLAERESLITRARMDPYRFVAEPDIWLVCDALMDFPWCSDVTRAMLLMRMGAMRRSWPEPLTYENVWEVFRKEMRRTLGCQRPIRHLLISGPNRSGKSHYSVSRSVRLACEYDWRAAGEDDVRLYFAHETHKRVVEDQMSLIYRYLPKELRDGTRKDQEAYVSYKPATGFSNDMLLTPNGIRVFFRSYEQEIEKALEGFTAKMVVFEENVPLSWADRSFTRLSDKNGWYIQPFTPIHGWTATVGMFQAGMRVVRESLAYALPKGMGEPDLARAVGLSEAEFKHVEACKWADPPRQACCPRSRPEDCLSWMEGEGAERRGPAGDLTTDGTERQRVGGVDRVGMRGGRGPEGDLTTEGTETQRVGGEDEGRWERVPRIALCADDRKAVVWFGTGDNPYSDAADVIRNNLSKGREEVLKCVYGVAVKSYSAKFARFSRDVHVVKDEEVPRNGLNGMVCDPAGTRNWAMAWYRLSGDAVWFYREFPSSTRETPGVGIMGPWAVSDDRNGGKNDGRKGPGQEPLGWSYLRYKREIARLEGWRDYQEWERMARENPAEYWTGSELVPTDAEVEQWEEDNGAEEQTDKIGDVRALSTPKQEKDRCETMQTLLDAIGLRLDFADGVEIEDGVSEINHRLDFERGPDGRIMRAPKLYIAESCTNLIAAAENWQNADGQKGAYKDFVDLIRYGVLRVRRAEFTRRSPTVVSLRGGRAPAPGVGRIRGKGQLAVGSGRLAVGSGEGFVMVRGAGGKCVMRARRR